MQTLALIEVLLLCADPAHHPDFPTRQDAAEVGPAVYQPFSKMLQFALEPLLLAATGADHAEPPGDLLLT